MGFKENIFNIFKYDDEEINWDSIENPDAKELYANDNPFDFYRNPIDKTRYIPITQVSLRKSFAEGIIEIEFFIEKATSLRPLEDEAQDIDEITRMFSQQKLASRPTPHSVEILRKMIKDPNPDIALYAAEGLNSIENKFIDEITKLKDKIENAKKCTFLDYYILGNKYLQFSKLLNDQGLIQEFYVKEALSNYGKSLRLKPEDLKVLRKLGEANTILKLYENAFYTFSIIINRGEKDADILIKLAECHFNLNNYDEVKKTAIEISKFSEKIDTATEMVIYQWIL